MKKIITLLGLFLVAFVPMTMAQIITITNVTSSKADGSYISGNIDITLTLAEPITTTSLVLGLALNNTAVVPLSVSDGTTSTLAFTYTIGAGEDTPDLETTGLTITSGSSEDGSAVPTTSFVLPTAGATGSLSKNKNLLIDTTVPTVSSVTSTNADDTCKVGSIIYVAVNFSEKVKVTGIPKIKLNTGAVDAYAYYTGGNNTNKLSFKYTVQVADTAIPELNYDATNSLELNSGTIKDYAGNNATLTLFSTAHANSLGGSKDIEIDGIRPAISTFAASGTDPAHAGDIITITIVFTQNVKITGAPRILLETGKTDHYATFVSGSGTKTLVFEYLVVAGDETSDLNAKSATALSGGTFKDEVGNDAVITLPALTGTILVDASAPKVTNVTSTKLNGTYKVGEIIPITITFDQAVTVTGTPQLTLDTINAVAPVVNYTSGSASNTLTFNYTVGATYNTADLSYAATNSLALNSGTIKDANNNNAVLTLANIGATGSLNRNKAIVIDNTNATVVSVRSTTVDGTYKIGSTVYVNVNFTEKVKVTGSPKIELETGTTNQFALYNGGNNSTKLTFKYIVQAGDTTPDLDYVATTSLILNGGFIKDYVGNDATLTLAVTGTGNSLGGSKAIEIDGIRPTISSFTTSGSNPANAGDNLTIKVIYDQPVLITGSPKILLETGKTDRYATYVSGSGTDTLVFNYLVVSGDETAILREKSASALTSGTFKDPNGNEAVITLPALSGGFLVDAILPTVLSVTSTSANGYYKQGAIIKVAVNFSEGITPTTPALVLETGATDRTAVYNAGLSTATKLIFDYTVQANDTALDLNYLATNSLSGTITDLNGNVSLKTLPALNSRNSLAGSKSLYVDAKQPTIINISSPTAAGTYNQRDIVYIKVYFDDKIKVVGKPKIKLNSSLTNFATYSSGSGSNALQFKYIVGVGDIANPLDFDSFQFVPGDSIKDYLGNYAVATYVGTGLSDKLIVINGSTKSAEIADAGITAIAEEKLNIVEGIGIYPNPAINGEVVMHFNGDSQNNKIEVNLFDVLGHKLVSEQIIGQNKAVIAKNLQPGIYIVSYVNGKQLFNQRILVK